MWESCPARYGANAYAVPARKAPGVLPVTRLASANIASPLRTYPANSVRLYAASALPVIQFRGVAITLTPSRCSEKVNALNAGWNAGKLNHASVHGTVRAFHARIAAFSIGSPTSAAMALPSDASRSFPIAAVAAVYTTRLARTARKFGEFNSDVTGWQSYSLPVYVQLPRPPRADLQVGRLGPRQVEERRSEERRVGKECRSRWTPDHSKKK